MKEIIKYHGNGEILIKYHVDDNGNIHGLYQRWYSNGQLWEEYHYINGYRHGLYQTWHSNGQLEKEVIFINNKFHGLYQKWHYNGQPHIKCHYINGSKHGLYQSWYSNGQLSREVIYINNEETSLQIPKSREEKILFKIKHGIEI